MMASTICCLDDLPLAATYRLFLLRQDVFVVERGWPVRELDGLDPRCLHLLVRDDGEIVACARIVPPDVAGPGTPPTLGRIAVVRERRGQGLGKKVVARALAEIEWRHPGQPIALSAQSHLIGFYEAFGFIAEGEDYDVFGVAHRHMVRPA